MDHLSTAQINLLLRAIKAETLAIQTTFQTAILATEHRIMTALDDNKAAVTAETAKVDGLLALYASALAKIAALQAAGGATPADLQALTDQLNAESAKIDAATAPAPAP